METLEPLLTEHPFLKGLKKEQIQLLTGCASNVRFEPGQTIFRAGEPATQFYLLRFGKVAIELHSAERGDLILQTLGEGEVVGWSWLVPPHRWVYDARAVELTRAIALDGECLRRKCDENHELGYELLKLFIQVIAGRLEATRLQVINIHGPMA